MRFASAGETFKQRVIFSIANRLRFGGRNNQIKLASARPNLMPHFSGNRQIKPLKHFRNLYSIEGHSFLRNKEKGIRKKLKSLVP